MQNKELNRLESAMLNTLIEDAKTRKQVLPRLNEKHIQDKTHASILRAITALSDNDLPIDMISVRNWLQRNEGGKNWAVEVATLDSKFLNDKPLHYATMIIEASMRRQLRAKLEISLQKVREDDNDVFDIVESLEKTIEEQMKNVESSGVRSFAEIKEQSKAEIASGLSPNVVFTGLPTFDELVGGFKSGDLIILAARPAMGKSALMNTWAKGIASTGVPVYMFSLEMEDTELIDRMVSGDIGVDNGDIVNRNLNELDRKLYLDKIDEVEDLPIFVYDKGGLTLREVKQKARLAKQTTGIGALFVDYIQLMNGGGNNRHEIVGDVSRGLKALAKELEIPIIALAQLSRRVEEREFKLPQLSDLKESGDIEQDADKVFFIWRPSYYGYKSLPFDPVSGEEIDTIVEESDSYIRAAKNRRGIIGTVCLDFQGRFTRFV